MCDVLFLFKKFVLSKREHTCKKRIYLYAPTILWFTHLKIIAFGSCLLCRIVCYRIMIRMASLICPR